VTEGMYLLTMPPSCAVGLDEAGISDTRAFGIRPCMFAKLIDVLLEALIGERENWLC